MKIILSRKGFDSSAGKVPSPIFPDGALLSLPIPDKDSKLAYQEIGGNHWASMGELVGQLARMPPTYCAHLDPDLRFSSISRAEGWKPIFGQSGAAESHLRNENVEPGDVFLYFGLFREVEKTNYKWRYVLGSKPKHVIFGWLQIASRVAPSAWPANEEWAHYHPHFVGNRDFRNMLYVSADRLSIPGYELNGVAGAGTFPTISKQLVLTEPGSGSASQWLLPSWFHPTDTALPLSYHRKQSRWQREERGAILSSVARGQEFVLDCNHYPEALGWLESLVTDNSG